MVDKISKLMSTKVFLLFILLQPVIDLLTSGSLLLLDWKFSFGTIIRSLFLGIMVLYLLYEGSKKIKIYSLILFTAFGVNLIVNFIYKNEFSFFVEIQYMIRYIYTLMALLTYITVINRNREKDIKSIISKYLYYYLIIIILVFVAAHLSDTVINSYSHHRRGHSGWFFAANDIGNTLGMLLPVSIAYAYRVYASKGSIFYFITPIAALYPLLILGTKGGYFAAVLGLGGAVTALGYDAFITRRKQAVKPLLLLSAVMVFSIAIYPKTYVSYNINYVVEVKTNEGNTIDETKEFVVSGGRENVIEETKEMSMKSDILQKVFGMGFKGNYADFYEKGSFINPIEKDFHELYYYYGGVGFFIYILPILYLLVFSVGKLILNYRKMSPDHLLYLTSIGIGLGVANFAGHVLSAPSVGYVLMLVMAVLYKDTMKLERGEEAIV